MSTLLATLKTPCIECDGTGVIYYTYFSTAAITAERIRAATAAYSERTGTPPQRMLVNQARLDQARAALTAAALPLTLEVTGGILSGEFWLTHEAS